MPTKLKGEKKEEITFKKGITKIHFPFLPDIQGESERAMKRIIESYQLPKISAITYQRTIAFGKHGYDLTEVIIAK